MNRDFHLFGTYCAAVIAGFTRDEAAEIAWAAQMVDDCSTKLLAKVGLTAPSNIPTSQEMGEMTASNAKYMDDPDNQALKKIRHIWMPFHFLPGNLNRSIPYTGKTSWGKVSHYDPASDGEDMRCICLHNSPLAQEMVNDTRNRYSQVTNSTKQELLYLIGIRMHVLADTWAHEFFAGTPNYWINDVSSSKITFLQNPKPDIDSSTTPAAPTDHSIAYLGHGPIGHLPDYSYLQYQFRPHWSGTDLVKDNPNLFKSAFCQMIDVMRGIRNNVNCILRDYTAQELAALPNSNSIDQILNFVNKTICTNSIHYDQTAANLLTRPVLTIEDAWIQFISSNPNFNPDTVSLNYDLSNPNPNRLAIFQKMVSIHLNQVCLKLHNEGIPGF